jgi:transposase
MEYKRYSEAFKLSVIREIVEGKWRGPLQAARAYRVSWAAVTQWMEQYGHGHLLRRVIRVETKGEQDEVKRLKAEVRKLKEALADAHVDLKLSKAYFDIVCEKQRLDPDVVKKNIAGKLGIEVPEKAQKKGS